MGAKRAIGLVALAGLACAPQLQSPDGGDLQSDAGAPTISYAEYTIFASAVGWGMRVSGGVAPVTISCALDDASFPCSVSSSGVSVSRIPPGSHALSVTATGANGKSSTTGDLVGFDVIAGALPQVLITSPQRGATVGSTVPLTFTIDAPDGGTVSCYLNDAMVPCDASGTATVTGLTVGDAVLTVRVDGVGIGNFDVATVHVMP